MKPSPIAKSLCVALLAVSAFASANESKPAAGAAKADPAKGEALYTNGDSTRNIAACVACHGAKGASTISANPKLGAQHEAYLVKQLTEFHKGERSIPAMSAFAKTINDADIKNLSAYLAKQPAKQGEAKDKDLATLGKKIYRGGIMEKNVPACAGCHGATGAGIPAQYPRLSGQHQDYTVAQLTAFSKDSRKNSAQMSTIAKRMSEQEMKAVADYVAGLK
ncbi:c-type cytochrome [Massilia sp. W12]|uniref:c-type cytochrome n=1 Tax=Massilia sp. W12 TaxID=3126507 RepID=UPI0030D596F7